VYGVVQSWKHRHLILLLPENAQTKEFDCNIKLEEGQKVRVFYFESSPEVVVYIRLAK
jgi:hypothetical protein